MGLRRHEHAKNTHRHVVLAIGLLRGSAALCSADTDLQHAAHCPPMLTLANLS